MFISNPATCSFLKAKNEPLRRKGERLLHSIIMGHTHDPTTRHIDGLSYANTGDFLINPHCTMLLEHFDASLELVRITRDLGVVPYPDRPAQPSQHAAHSYEHAR